MPAVETPWQHLLRYIESREPTFRQQTREVSQDDVERLFAGFRRPLPESVRELMSTMGHGSEVFWPFDRCCEVDIHAMLEDWEDQWIADRFFRVAITNKDDGISYADLYVDLGADDPLDPYDPKLIEVPIPWDGRVSHARSHTLMSKAVSSAFSTFELTRSGEHGYLGQSIEAREFADYAKALRALVSRMRLETVFAPRAEIQCFRGEAMSLMFDGLEAEMPAGVVPGSPLPSWFLVVIWIGATDLDHLR